MSLSQPGAYVHLPWCVRKCPYCDFNSHNLRADSDYTQYVDAVLADLQWSMDQRSWRPLRSVFFGGGTPSLCPPEQIARIIQALAARPGLGPNAEITLEANPGTADEAHFGGYRQAGVNRLSIGVQSFQDDKLKALGRIHDHQAADRAIDLARAAGFDNINIDIMHGLPQQSVEDALYDLDRALGHHPEHLSWYELTLEPQTAFARRPPELPQEDTLAAIETQGRRRLRSAGFRRYEVSAWAQPSRRARHNLNYWRYGDFLALGAGAHEKHTDHTGLIQRSARQRAPGRYLSTAGSAQVMSQQTQPCDADRVEEFLLNACRLVHGFSLRHFERTTGLGRDRLGPGLRRARELGLLSETHNRVQPTALGLRYLNSLLMCFAEQPDAG
jgi:oxygen-independent coproporphyrinogen-3 oxidase